MYKDTQCYYQFSYKMPPPIKWGDLKKNNE